jgi:hypothetical protein
MNAFARIASSVRRWVAPAALAASVIAGSVGFSGVASAAERGPVAAPHAVVGARGAVRPGVGFRAGPGWRGRYWGRRGFAPPAPAWRPEWRGRGFHGGERRGFEHRLGHGGFHGGHRR